MAKTKKLTHQAIERITITGILTAIVVVLQLFASGIKFGPFSISLVLVPIVVGAATAGAAASAWLGFVFGLVVLLSGDAAAFLAVSVPGTIITVLLKGTLAGLCTGLVYRAFEKAGKPYPGVILSAIVCPVVNTGIFVLGCFAFFFETIAGWGASAGATNTVAYIFTGMIGINFLIELGVNVVLGPSVFAVLNAVRKGKSHSAR